MKVARYASTPVCGRSAPDAAPDFFPSGNNPYWINRMARPFGRQLRGLGGPVYEGTNGARMIARKRPLLGLGLLPDTTLFKDTWSGDDPAVQQAAQADDVAGNGIFDGAGAPPTAHAGTGVFSSNFSLPGYVYREQPGEPSEVVDTTTGNPIIYQPGPANWYADMRETYRPFDVEVPRYYSSTPSLRPGPMSGLGADPASPSVGEQIKAYGPWVLVGVGAAMALLIALKMTGQPEGY